LDVAARDRGFRREVRRMSRGGGKKNGQWE
jgi:hypothetical protein